MLVGIRREDKNEWEKRIPIIPNHIKELSDEKGIEFIVQPSKIRIFKDKEFKRVGARVSDDLSGCKVVFAVKEIPKEMFLEGKIYVFFAHVIKGQSHNMPMLKRLMELGCTLIDYEKVTDEKGRRLIFFGRHAGLAGMIDALWALGRRYKWEGLKTPLSKIKQAWKYHSLDEAIDAIKEVGEKIKNDGFPADISPLVFGFAGYGNVSKGAQEIIDVLPIKEVSPQGLHELAESGEFSNKVIYKVVFYEKDMVEPADPNDKFELSDYFNHPEKYRSIFTQYVPDLTVLINCIYWDARYPRLVTKDYLCRMYESFEPKLKVIGDISCDVDGAIECTIKCMKPGNPVFVWDMKADQALDGVEGEGPVVLAVDILPSEIPQKSSMDFSEVLKAYVEPIAKADYSVDFERLELPPEIKKAVIVYKGNLTPDYEYLKKFL